MFSRLCGIGTGAWLTLLVVPVCAQDVGTLLPYVPRDANSLAVFRIRDLNDSPRGRAEDWAEQHETEYLAGAANIPPWVELLVRATYVRPGNRGGDWTAVLLPLPRNHSMQSLAERESSQVQQISGRQVVHSPRHQGYFIEFPGLSDGEPRVLGGIAPASRQDASRWIEASERARGAISISDFLVEAANIRDAQVVLALDTRHMLDPAMIKHRLDGSPALADHPTEREALESALESLRGIKLLIQVQNAIHMAIQLDFEVDLGPEGEYVKPVFLELLNDLGAVLDELDTAEAFIYPRTVSIETPLSDESLRRVLSLITTPPTSHGVEIASEEVSPSPDVPTATPDGPDVRASVRYLDAVNRNIDDLLRAFRRAQNYERTAQWHDNFANRIDNLSTAGVDPDLVAYGAKISSALRMLANSLRGTAVDVNILEQSVVFNVQTQPIYSGLELWWGVPQTPFGPYTYGRPVNVQVTSNLQEVRERQAEAVRATTPERERLWQLINEERAAIQKTMIDRYGEAFSR